MKVTRFDNVTTIKADEIGVTLICGEHEIFLSWKVIDEIAEVSESHYQSQIIRDFATMVSQKTIN